MEVLQANYATLNGEGTTGIDKKSEPDGPVRGQIISVIPYQVFISLCFAGLLLLLIYIFQTLVQEVTYYLLHYTRKV